MPFWNKSSPEDQQRLHQTQQEAEASLRSLEAGGLPVQATRRLKEVAESDDTFFTSDLSVNEFSLARNQGYRPLSQVMGSSLYQVGWQYPSIGSSYTSLYELTTLSQAHQRAAQLALGRLEQEATLLQAHGVIGVRLTTRNYEWGANLLEYTAIGTAIRLPETPLPKLPFLSALSGQEFWTLLQAGYNPVGMVTSYCAYYVASGWDVRQQLYGWTNQEILPFSQAVYEARSLAMDRITTQARKLKANGVAGMHIESFQRVIEYEVNEIQYRDLLVHFSATGTAISGPKKGHVISAPRPTLTFTDLRPGQRGATSELTLGK